MKNLPPLPKAIIFDYGNTLVETGSLTDAVDDLAKKYHDMFQQNILRCIAKQVDSKIASLYDADQVLQPDYIEVWHEALHSNGVKNVDPQEFAEDHLKAFTAKQKLFGETRCLLETLSSRKIPLAIASNVTGPSTYFKSRLEELGIHHFFKVLVFSSEIGLRKPSEQFFDQVIEIAGWNYARSKMLMIGDSETADIVGGNRSGLATVRVTTGKMEQTVADHQMSLLELLRWAKSL